MNKLFASGGLLLTIHIAWYNPLLYNSWIYNQANSAAAALIIFQAEKAHKGTNRAKIIDDNMVISINYIVLHALLIYLINRSLGVEDFSLLEPQLASLPVVT